MKPAFLLRFQYRAGEVVLRDLEIAEGRTCSFEATEIIIPPPPLENIGLIRDVVRGAFGANGLIHGIPVLLGRGVGIIF